MQLPPLCGDEDRLGALYRCAILDTPCEPAFDDITRLVAHICQTPIALISFVDKDRQWFKSEIGLGVRETPLETSLCAHALAESDLFIVHDTLEDERFRDYPLVTGDPHLRFYAGAQLRTTEGHALGTLCVLDYKPRTLTPEQIEALSALSRQVMSQLELRRLITAQRRALEEQERLDASLRSALSEAEAANQAKDRFLATLSHELRTPLSPALMTAAALANDDTLPDSVRQDARLIERNIELETRLIDDLLDVTRIATGKLQLHIERIDLHRVLKDSVATCALDAQNKGVSMHLDLRAGQHAVRGDGAKLQQVFCNLLKNAVKFTPEAGRITVTSANESSGRVQVRIADTGIGVKPELLPHLFDPFEQGGNCVTRQYGGLGLGLAISRGIIEAHGGAIMASSEGKDCGTTMAVELETVQQAKGVVPAPRAVPSAAVSEPQLKILLVEDHEDTLRAMSRLLSKLKHRVTTATSVSTALKAANETIFDMVISDLGLPDGTGLDLMRQLVAQQPIRGIALTGYGMEADIQNTRDAGFARHLTKPINFPDLEAAIRDLAGG